MPKEWGVKDAFKFRDLGNSNCKNADPSKSIKPAKASQKKKHVSPGLPLPGAHSIAYSYSPPSYQPYPYQQYQYQNPPMTYPPPYSCANAYGPPQQQQPYGGYPPQQQPYGGYPPQQQQPPPPPYGGYPPQQHPYGGYPPQQQPYGGYPPQQQPYGGYGHHGSNQVQAGYITAPNQQGDNGTQMDKGSPGGDAAAGATAQSQSGTVSSAAKVDGVVSQATATAANTVPQI